MRAATDRYPLGPHLAGVLWDMDGTLIESRALWEAAYHELAEQQGVMLTPQFWERIAGHTLESSVELLCGHLKLVTNHSTVEGACSWLTARVLQLIDDQPALVQWRPGARQALQAVQRAGIPTALVTTTRRNLTNRMISTVGARFDATVCGDEVARGKPAPDPYLRAVALLGACTADCVVVEDSVTGVAAAEAAAIAVLAIPSHTPIDPSPRRAVRTSLTGLTVADLTAVRAHPRGGGLRSLCWPACPGGVPG